MLIKGLRSLILVSGTGLVLFACAFSFDRPLRPIENLIYDVMMRASAQPFERSAPLALVDVDEYSLSVMGQWPWPRNQLATLVDRVNEGGADVLAFDAIFAEPDLACLVFYRRAMKKSLWDSDQNNRNIIKATGIFG